MTRPHEDDTGNGPSASATPDHSARNKSLVLLAVALVFIALIGMRMAQGMRDTTPADSAPAGESSAAGVPDPATSLETALDAGRPIYVLFHSSTCAPCVEIDAVASRIVPEYDGRISFVDVYTDDPRAQPLFSQFAFQYIPTSFFLASDGSVAEQYTGVLNDEEMRAKFDALLDASAGS